MKSESIITLPADRPMLYSVASAATALSVAARTIRNYIDQGNIPALRVGARVLIRREDLEAFIDSLPRNKPRKE